MTSVSGSSGGGERGWRLTRRGPFVTGLAEPVRIRHGPFEIMGLICHIKTPERP